jgi:diguanylate cyclase (GGDEF)-like protein
MPEHDDIQACSAELEAAIAALLALLRDPQVADTPPALAAHAEFANLYARLLELRRFTLTLAGGELDEKLTQKGYLAGSLKTLQANLRHVTWQTQMIAAGDFSQRVEFMGDFSEAFNSMVERLAQAREALEREIDERERAEGAEREQRQFAEALQRTGQVLGASLEQEVIFDQLLALARSVVAYDVAFLLRFDGETPAIARAAGADAPETLLKEIPPCLLRVPCCAEQQITPDPARRMGSWTGAPVFAGEQIIGVLVVGSCETGAYTARHSERLAAFAGQAALALQNARLYRDMQRMATEDPLTGIFNRRHFFARATAEVTRAIRGRQPLACIMLDIDHFKRVNDTHGHLVGDQTLRQTAGRCADLLRPYDLFARYGGEEFVILLPATEVCDALIVAERLRQAIEDTPVQAGALAVPITISLGVSSRGSEIALETEVAERVITELIDEADRALYFAKQHGRNRVAHWCDVADPAPA